VRTPINEHRQVAMQRQQPNQRLKLLAAPASEELLRA